MRDGRGKEPGPTKLAQRQQYDGHGDHKVLLLTDPPNPPGKLLKRSTTAVEAESERITRASRVWSSSWPTYDLYTG